MKKILLMAAAIATMTGCTNDFDQVEMQETEYGTIVLNMDADNSLSVTRGVQTVTNFTDWEVQIEKADGTAVVAWKGYSSYTDDDWTKPYGTYTVKVRNNSGAFATGTAGKAVYEGSASVTVSAATNAVTVACGTQKTSQVKVTFNDSFKNTFNTYVLAVTDANVSGRTFSTAVDVNPLAYFLPDGDTKAGVTYKLTGILNGQTGQKVLAELTTAKRLEAADLLDIQVSAKTEGGKIVITITYDDTVNTVTESVTIDPTEWSTMTAA